MRRPLLLASLGFVLFLIFAVILWPASVAVSWLVPGGASLAGVTGTVWEGSASQVRIGIVDVGSLRWDARPGSFLLGRPSWDLKAERPDGFVSGTVILRGSTDVQALNLKVAATLRSLSGWINLAGTDGNLSVNIPELRLESGQLSRFGGTAVVDSMKPLGLKEVNLGSIEIEIPVDQPGPFQGVVRALDGPLIIDQGRVEIQTTGRYVLDGLVAAKPDAPQEIVQGLEFLGQADNRGFRSFSQQGAL